MRKLLAIFCFLLLLTGISYADTVRNYMLTPPPAPNTILGVKKVAKDGDYVLLRGKFEKKISESEYIFKDEKEDSLIVSFEQVIPPRDFTLDYPYYIWGEIRKRSIKFYLDVKSISPKL